MHTWPQISKKDADCFVPGQWIPECELVVEWREQKQPTRLWHEVFLTGAKAPGNYFNLVLDPTEGSYIYMSATLSQDTCLCGATGIDALMRQTSLTDFSCT